MKIQLNGVDSIVYEKYCMQNVGTDRLDLLKTANTNSINDNLHAVTFN